MTTNVHNDVFGAHICTMCWCGRRWHIVSTNADLSQLVRRAVCRRPAIITLHKYPICVCPSHALSCTQNDYNYYHRFEWHKVRGVRRSARVVGCDTEMWSQMVFNGFNLCASRARFRVYLLMSDATPVYWRRGANNVTRWKTNLNIPFICVPPPQQQ